MCTCVVMFASVRAPLSWVVSSRLCAYACLCLWVFVEEQERVHPISKTLTIFHDTVPKSETVQN